MLLVVYAGDLRPLPVICTTDYVNTLYVGGYMMNHGEGRELYPKASATSFYAEKFSERAKQLLPPTGKTWLYLFTYPSMVALMAAPLAVLDPVASLIAWQLLSLLALAASAFFFANTGSARASALTVLTCSFLFLPLLNVIVIGQTSLLLGLLPLTAGYCFWQRDRFFLAGLVWSLLGLKPQLALPIVIIVTSLLIAAFAWKPSPLERREPLRMIAGLTIGTLIMHAVPALLLGFDSFSLWIHAVKMSGQAFGAEETGYWQYHLFFSLPCVVILLLPKSAWQMAKTPSYVLGGISMLIGVWASCKLIAMRISAERRKDLLIMLAVPLMIAAAPHLLLYDTCLLLLPGWVLFFKLTATDSKLRRAKLAAFGILCAFDIYLFAILAPFHFDAAFYQAAIVLTVLIYTFIFFLQVSTDRGTVEQFPT
jgi:hypothetical protein